MKVRVHHPRRVGRPQKKWATVESHRLWNLLQEGETDVEHYDEEQDTHRTRLLTLIEGDINQ